MATWTGTQLANQVLRELGVVGAGQDIPGDQVSKVTEVWPSIYRRLRNEGLAGWGSDAIEEEAQHPLAQYVAGEVAASFGFSGGRLNEHRTTGALGLRGLQQAAAGDKHVTRPKFKDY
jgi:hypothetical protein